jgi:hypothetical protein
MVRGLCFFKDVPIPDGGTRCPPGTIGAKPALAVTRTVKVHRFVSLDFRMSHELSPGRCAS